MYLRACFLENKQEAYADIKVSVGRLGDTAPSSTCCSASLSSRGLDNPLPLNILTVFVALHNAEGGGGFWPARSPSISINTH